jgi:hypothetical protein
MLPHGPDLRLLRFDRRQKDLKPQHWVIKYWHLF